LLSDGAQPTCAILVMEQADPDDKPTNDTA